MNNDFLLKEECGVFGFFDKDNDEAARFTYYGLYALQHRGQESCGIAVNDKGTIVYHKDMGLVSEVFNDTILNHLRGQIAIGHVRYSTTGNSLRENTQPLVIKYSNGTLAIAHNGNLINTLELKKELENEGAIFQTTIDSEVIAYLIARNRMKYNSTEETIKAIMSKLKGSYSLVIMGSHKLIGVRDPWGIRPLCIGKLNNSYVIASETCALETINATYIRDVKPGEIITIDKKGLHSTMYCHTRKSHLCIFEYIYFARQDSYLEGISVYEARKEMGRTLAKEYPVEADLVIGVPDSGIAAAIGYAEASGIHYGEGLVKNRYIGRTFIQPNQNQRKDNVRIKLNALKQSIEGKRIVIIDDSIVRGTTTDRIIKMLKEAGAKEVHIRISSPPFLWPCYFGTDIPSRKELIACKYSIKKMNKIFSSDTLAYLDVDSLKKIIPNNKCDFCDGCFSGKYPMETPNHIKNFSLEKSKKKKSIIQYTEVI